MSMALPRVRLWEAVEPVSRSILPSPGETYRQLGVSLWGKGAYEREPVDGGLTKYRQLFRAEQGDIVVNKIWARNGSVAVVDNNLAGCHGSNEFPMFAPIKGRLDPRWMHWVTKTKDFWAQCDQKSQGTSGQNRIKPERFLDIEIPLPSLDEQRRIVTRIEELAEKVEEAQNLRRNLQNEILVLPRALLSHQPSHRRIRVGEFASLRPPDVKVDPLEEYHFAGVYSFGRGVFQGQRKLGSEFAYPKLTRLQAGNFVYPKLMAWEGALGIVPPECDGLVVSTEFPVFEIDNKVMLPEVVDTYFRSPEVWPGLSGQSGGTNVRRRRLNPNDFLNLQVPWPDYATQAAIKQCVSRVSAIRALQAKTAAELDAMLPAILDKAFRGELP